MQARVKKPSSMSNRVSVATVPPNIAPIRITGAANTASPRSGHRRRARAPVRSKHPSANTGATTLADTSLTPKAAHPTLISQKRSGGLCA